MAWAIGVTEKVTQITGLNVSLFTPMFSPEVGTLSWSTFVPDLATLESATDKLAADPGYISMIDAGAKFGQGGADVNELDRAQQKLAADTKFAAFIHKSVPGVYTDQSTVSRQFILRRIV